MPGCFHPRDVTKTSYQNIPILEETIMKTWKQFLNAMTAAAFAEAGEFQTALELLNNPADNATGKEHAPLTEACRAN